MSNDTEKRDALLSALKAAHSKDDGSFVQTNPAALEHGFEHLDGLNCHVSLGDLTVKTAASIAQVPAPSIETSPERRDPRCWPKAAMCRN